MTKLVQLSSLGILFSRLRTVGRVTVFGHICFMSHLLKRPPPPTDPPLLNQRNSRSSQNHWQWLINPASTPTESHLPCTTQCWTRHLFWFIIKRQYIALSNPLLFNTFANGYLTMQRVHHPLPCSFLMQSKWFSVQ